MRADDDRLTAPGELDCGELLLVVLLERRAELVHQVRARDGQGFDVCHRGRLGYGSSSEGRVEGGMRTCENVCELDEDELANIYIAWSLRLGWVLRRLTSPGGAPSTKEETIALWDDIVLPKTCPHYPRTSEVFFFCRVIGRLASLDREGGRGLLKAAVSRLSNPKVRGIGGGTFSGSHGVPRMGSTAPDKLRDTDNCHILCQE